MKYPKLFTPMKVGTLTFRNPSAVRPQYDVRPEPRRQPHGLHGGLL